MTFFGKCIDFYFGMCYHYVKENMCHIKMYIVTVRKGKMRMNNKICPFCGKELSDEAILCKYCHNLLLDEADAAEAAADAHLNEDRTIVFNAQEAEGATKHFTAIKDTPPVQQAPQTVEPNEQFDDYDDYAEEYVPNAEDEPDDEDNPNKRIFIITAVITICILVVIILAIIAGYKIFGYSSDSSSTAAATSKKLAVVTEEDSKSDESKSDENKNGEGETTTTKKTETNEQKGGNDQTDTQTQAPDEQNTDTQTQTQAPDEQNTDTQTQTQVSDDTNTDTQTQQSQDNANDNVPSQDPVAAISSQIDGEIDNYTYREDDATYSYYYFYTTDGHGYSVAYNKNDGSCIIVQNY